MSGRLAEGVEIVGKMTAIRDDGAPVAIVWLKFPQESDEAAEAYELRKDACGQIRLEACNLGPFDNWRQLAALTGG